MDAQFIEPADFEAFIRASRPLLDVRSEGEFNDGALPNSVNIPILNNTERHEVGLCYKEHGQEKAIELGFKLVNAEIKEERIRRWKDFLKNHPNAALFCWRGGLRSKIAAEWLAESGVQVPRVRGGYKALRRYLLQSIDTISEAAVFHVVTGKTGSGKTHLLHALEANGAKVLDLEGYAKHRGSAFGRLPIAQPAQVTFENLVAARLVELHKGPGPIIVEDESRMVGKIKLPDSLFIKMKEAPLIVLETGEIERVDNIIKDYIEYHLTSAPASHDRFTYLEEFLCGSLLRIRDTLGTERWKEIDLKIRAAIAKQRVGQDARVHEEWITKLLSDYYDPFYEGHLMRGATRVLFRGGRQAIISKFVPEVSNKAA